MEATIRAIETEYKGYRFRSRLEARWAVFFDALGLKWEYEKEGFELAIGRYLPDFFMPEMNGYIEIKPPSIKYEDEMLALEKLGQLSLLTGRISYLMIGDPWDALHENTSWEVSFAEWDFLIQIGIPELVNDLINIIVKKYPNGFHKKSGQLSFSKFSGIADRNFDPRLATPRQNERSIYIVPSGWGKEIKLKAAKKARSARFEYGESG